MSNIYLLARRHPAMVLLPQSARRQNIYEESASCLSAIIVPPMPGGTLRRFPHETPISRPSTFFPSRCPLDASSKDSPSPAGGIPDLGCHDATVPRCHSRLTRWRSRCLSTGHVARQEQPGPFHLLPFHFLLVFSSSSFCSPSPHLVPSPLPDRHRNAGTCRLRAGVPGCDVVYNCLKKTKKRQAFIGNLV